jgi:hypothetical protein
MAGAGGQEGPGQNVSGAGYLDRLRCGRLGLGGEASSPQQQGRSRAVAHDHFLEQPLRDCPGQR